MVISQGMLPFAGLVRVKERSTTSLSSDSPSLNPSLVRLNTPSWTVAFEPFSKNMSAVFWENVTFSRYTWEAFRPRPSFEYIIVVFSRRESDPSMRTPFQEAGAE